MTGKVGGPGTFVVHRGKKNWRALSDLPYRIASAIYVNDNDNDKGMGAYSKGRPARSQKYNTPKLKMDNEKKHFAIFHKCQ